MLASHQAVGGEQKDKGKSRVLEAPLGGVNNGELSPEEW